MSGGGILIQGITPSPLQFMYCVFRHISYHSFGKHKTILVDVGLIVTFEGPLSLHIGLCAQYRIHKKILVRSEPPPPPPPPSQQCQYFHFFSPTVSGAIIFFGEFWDLGPKMQNNVTFFVSKFRGEMGSVGGSSNLEQNPKIDRKKLMAPLSITAIIRGYILDQSEKIIRSYNCV